MVKIELYVNGEPKEIENDKIYKMASSMYVLSETSGEDFAKGDSYEIIHKKALDKKFLARLKLLMKKWPNISKEKELLI